MKKAKIMLMAIAVFGVVGGALAFKTSKFLTGKYGICATTAVGGPTLCLKNITTTGTPTVTGTIYTSTTTIAPSSFGCENTVVAVPYYCTGVSLLTTQGLVNPGE